MKVLILDGTERGSGEGISQVIQDAAARCGHAVDQLTVRDLTIAPCKGCFHCWYKTPGLCTTADDGRLVAQRVIESHAIILVTTMRFGGYSSHLKRAVDRLIPNISPLFTQIQGETHHAKRYPRYPRFLAIGLLEAPDAEGEQLFATIVSHNALNMRAPAAGTAIIYNDEPEAQVRNRLAELFRTTGVTA